MPDEFDKQTKRAGNPAWVKGKSANPRGRPKKDKSLVNIIEQYLDMTLEQLKEISKDEKLPLKNRLAIKYIIDCHEHPTHTDKLMDRLYGAPQSMLDVTSNGKELRQSRVYNIINPETRGLMERLENEGRLELNRDISPESKQLPEPPDKAVT